METEARECIDISTPKRYKHAKRRARQALRRSNIPKHVWKYYIEPPEEWEWEDLYNGIDSIFMKNSFQNMIPWWMRGMTKDRLVNLKLKFTAATRAREESEKYNSKMRFNNRSSLNYKKKQASIIYRKLKTAEEELYDAANTVNNHGEKLYTTIDDGRFEPGYVPLNRIVQDHINALVMDMDVIGDEIREGYFNDYNEEIRDSYITKKQPSFTKEGVMQILEKSTIPSEVWKYYNESPKTWNYNDHDETGLHNGIKSILMMNSLPNVVPWWLHEPLSFARTMSIDTLIELKLKFKAVIQAKEDLAEFASKAKLNNHLGSEYKQKQASMLNVNLQTANAQLHEETNRFVDHKFQFPDETFRNLINEFVMETERRGNNILYYITEYLTDHEKGNISPASPEPNESKNDEDRKIENVDEFSGYLISPLKKKYDSFFKSTMCTLKALRC